MTNTQNTNEQIKAIEEFLEKYKLALLFNQHKLARLLSNTLYVEDKSKPTDEMMIIYDKIVGEQGHFVGMLDDLASVAAGPREAIMEVLLGTTQNISAILPYKYMSLQSVIAELESATKTKWGCAQRYIALENDYDHTKHKFSGYFLLKGVPQEEAEKTYSEIDIENLRWGEAIPVSNIVLSERVRENYLSNSNIDLHFGEDNKKIFDYHNSIAATKMSLNKLINCIDLSYAFSSTNKPKVQPVALDNLLYDGRNCNFAAYEDAVMKVLAKFFTSQPQLVLERLSKKIDYLAKKQQNGSEETEDSFEAIERE